METTVLRTGAEESLSDSPSRDSAPALPSTLPGDLSLRAGDAFKEGQAEQERGNLDAAARRFAEAAALYERLGNRAQHLAAEQAAGRMKRDLGKFSEAAAHLERAFHLAQALCDLEAEADVLNLQASVRSAEGEPQEALDLLRMALRLVRKLGLAEREANLLNNVGELQRLLGQFPEALESLRSAYDLYATLPSVRGAVVNLVCLGNLYQEMGNHKEARQLFERTLDAGREAADPFIEAAARNNLANLDLKAGNLHSAQAGFEAALAIARSLGTRQYEVDNLDGLGQVYVALGNYPAAAAVHQTSYAVATEIGDREGELDALLNLGRDHFATGDPKAAEIVLRQGLELAVRLEHQTSVYRAHELLAQTLEMAGDFRAALAHQKAFYDAEKAVFNEESERRTRKLAVQFELERARHEAEEYRLRTQIKQEALEEAEATVRERTQELEEAQLEIVTRLAVAAEYRDDDTGEHTRRVGRNAAALAYALGWAEEDVKLIYTAARLHDVGKIGIPDAVLLKPGKLDWDEMELMRNHTRIGASILSSGHSKLLRMAEEIALHHHERFDGKGYPLGIAGQAIPLTARIIAVADVLDALTHERPYKRAWSTEEALAEISRQAGRHFDPDVVAACLSLFGLGGVLSPTDAPTDWYAITQALEGVTPLRNWIPADDPATLKLRYEKMLADKAHELVAVQRKARADSRSFKVLAFTDVLTGLGNRRAFEEDWANAFARAELSGDPLLAAVLDLDNLKLVNDGEGHERGDRLIAHFAKATTHYLGKLGRLYRVGGDEFACIVADGGASAEARFRSVMERVIREVRELGFPTTDVSTGIAHAFLDGTLPGQLLEIADARMYADKETKQSRGRGAER